MTKTSGEYAFRLIHLSMLEHRAQFDFNCAIPLAQFTTVFGKCALLHVSEKLLSKLNEAFLIGREAFNRSQWLLLWNGEQCMLISEAVFSQLALFLKVTQFTLLPLHHDWQIWPSVSLTAEACIGKTMMPETQREYWRQESLTKLFYRDLMAYIQWSQIRDLS